MYRRFLNNDDYLGIITPEALAQLTRGNDARFIQAEESAEMSIVEYLSENYEIEKELAKGKYIAEYDRRITYPVGVHVYFEGQIHEVIRSVSGYRKPATATVVELTFCTTLSAVCLTSDLSTVCVMLSASITVVASLSLSFLTVVVTAVGV